MTYFKAARLLQGLTLAEVSKRSKVNVCKLSYAERGLLPLTAKEHKKLAKILRLSSKEENIVKVTEENKGVL